MRGHPPSAVRRATLGSLTTKRRDRRSISRSDIHDAISECQDREPKSHPYHLSLDSPGLQYSNSRLYLQPVRQTPRLRLQDPVHFRSRDGAFGIVDVERPCGPTTVYQEIGAWHCVVLESLILSAERQIKTMANTALSKKNNATKCSKYCNPALRKT